MKYNHAQHHHLSEDILPPNALWAESLNLGNVRQSWGDAKAAKTCMDNPITLNKVVFQHGIGSHARSTMIIDLKGAAARFETIVGLDDEAQRIVPIIFELWVDGIKKAESGKLWKDDEPEYLSVDLKGAQRLLMRINDGGEWISYAHADWAGALLHMLPGTTETPETLPAPPEERKPIPNMDDKMAAIDNKQLGIHGPRVYGATPGKPFTYKIPATGGEPLTFTAQNLPEGLSLDAHTGLITGQLKNDGTTKVMLTVQSGNTPVHREFTIIAGKNKLAQTPPMGWNSWNVWGMAIDDQKVRDAADSMVQSGLAAHGFQYINIDDAWEGERDRQGNIQPNEKFPDMKALSDYIHSKGLKLGIYSSPGPRTCGGYLGSYHHEQQDADTYAAWGVDFLKYDWCSYQKIVKEPTTAERIKPYRLMADSLEKSPRDIVLSICQYGQGNVSQWGAEAGGNLWRTTGDIGDYWNMVYDYICRQVGLEQYAGPGHWNDPDMLVVGSVGWGPSLHPTELSPHEQISHITIWCMLAAPLLIGCDLTDLDDFTLNLLSNDEVLAVDQDPLGVQASRIQQVDGYEIWLRPLYDGTMAVAVLNRLKEENEITIHWKDIRVEGTQPVRDLWLQKDLGAVDQQVKVTLEPHSSCLYKIGQPTNQ